MAHQSPSDTSHEQVVAHRPRLPSMTLCQDTREMCVYCRQVYSQAGGALPVSRHRRYVTTVHQAEHHTSSFAPAAKAAAQSW